MVIWRFFQRDKERSGEAGAHLGSAILRKMGILGKKFRPGRIVSRAFDVGYGHSFLTGCGVGMSVRGDVCGLRRGMRDSLFRAALARYKNADAFDHLRW